MRSKICKFARRYYLGSRCHVYYVSGATFMLAAGRVPDQYEQDESGNWWYIDPKTNLSCRA